MVTIINGEIVQDNDPRAQEFRNRGRRQQEQQHQRTQGSQNQNYPPVQQGGSIFDQLNDRLISAGFPRWNLGQNVVEPIVSVALILAVVLFGFQGLLLVGVLWLITQQSRRWAGCELRKKLNRMAFTDFIQIWNSFYVSLKSRTHCWTENRGKLAYIVFIIIEGTFTKVIRLILVNYRKNLISQLIKSWRRFLMNGLDVMLVGHFLTSPSLPRSHL